MGVLCHLNAYMVARRHRPERLQSMNWEEGTYTPVLVWPGVSSPMTRPLPALPFYCSRNIHGVGGNVGAGGEGIRKDKHIALLAWSSSETLSHLLGHKFYLSRKKSTPSPPACAGLAPCHLPQVTSFEGKGGTQRSVCSARGKPR